MRLLHKGKVVFMMILALVGAMLCVWYFTPISPFIPVFNVWIDHEQHLVSKLCRLGKQENDSLTKVLESDSQIFLVFNRMIFVTPRLFFDKELIWNYTSKAGIAFPQDNYIRDHKYNIWRPK